LVRNALASSLLRNPVHSMYRRLGGENTLTTNGGGSLTAVISCAPSISSDWTSLTGLYDEWRLLGGRFRIFCNVQNVPYPTISSVPNVVCFDNDDASAALGSYTNGMTYPQRMEHASIWDNSNYPTLVFQKDNSSNPGTGPLFQSTGSASTSPCSIKNYMVNATASTTYFSYFLDLIIEFRSPL